ncbi:MAG: HNH endonuclease signature motif containing protein [Candidatus Binataceae bacterium]
MPIRPKHPCNRPGCPALTNERFCDAHRRRYNRLLNAERGTARQRGYDGDWERFRKLVLSRRPLCESFCAKEGRTVAATELHHIIPLRSGGERLSGENVLPICGPCHRRITARESR